MPPRALIALAMLMPLPALAQSHTGTIGQIRIDAQALQCPAPR
jgi:hypothetical protein